MKSTIRGYSSPFNLGHKALAVLFSGSVTVQEQDELENEMRDIPKLMREINRDVLEDCGDEIREKLFKHFWKQISRGLTHGMPEWYKETLAREALEIEGDISVASNDNPKK